MPTWSPGSMPCACEVVREPVGPRFHLGVGAALALGDEVLAIGEVVDGVLEEIGEVVLHGRQARTRSRRDAGAG